MEVIPIMMGQESKSLPKLFHYNINLDERVGENHILRKIRRKINFDFVYKEVEGLYGDNGNVSVPPTVIIKMLLLLVLYNIRSERELMLTIPVRLDWMWFLGYDLDSDIPNHSVLSKARKRWGVKTFKSFFERIVLQCVETGLVDGSKLFVDSSLIEANASNNSVIDTYNLKSKLAKGYKHLEDRLDDIERDKVTPVNSRYVSGTDRDATVVRQGNGRSKLRYKTHRGVDPKHEVITATKLTTGSADEGEYLDEMIRQHKQNTFRKVDTVVCDSKYGKIDNFLNCHDEGINAHIPSLEKGQRGTGSQKDIFPKEEFSYNVLSDTFRCPSGSILKRRNYYKKRQHYEYKASPQVCNNCQLKKKCTRAKDGRTLKRHMRQDDLDIMLRIANSPEAIADIKTRQHLSERSFAQSKRYGYKRSRWRQLWRMEIQDFLIAAVQNIQILVKDVKKSAQSMASALNKNAKVSGIINISPNYSQGLLQKLIKTIYFCQYAILVTS